MADDFIVNAKITADSSNFNSELNKAKKTTNDLGKGVAAQGKSIENSFSSITAKATKIAGVIGGVAVAFKGVAKVMKETSDAYKVQAKAEIQLETAVKNNPLINNSATENLKNFASEMQKVSTVGDEQLIPLMANLISSGRTEEETMNIVRASLDLSASGMVNLETAIKQLNNSYNGSIGLLGRQIGELKNLTEEELKSGKAVDIVAKKFKGMSEETTKATGTAEQLANTWGDLKEEIGAPIETGILAPFRQGLIDMIDTTITGIKNLKKAIQDAKTDAENISAVESGSATNEQLIAAYDYEKKRLEDLRDIYKEMLNNSASYSATEISNAQQAVQSYTVQIAKLDDKYKVALNSVEKQKEETAEIEKQNELLAKRNEIEQTVGNLKKDANKALDEQLEKWKAQEQITGKVVSAEEKLNFYQQNLIDVVAKANGEISETNEIYKSRMAEIERLQKQVWVEGNRQRYEEDMENFHEIEDMKVQAIIEKNKRIKDEEDKAREEEEKAREEMLQSIKDTISQIPQAVANITKDVVNVVKKVINSVKSVLTTGFNTFKKLLDFNISDALDTLLKLEDSILTFFTSTIYQLPKFVDTVIGSIGNILNFIDEKLKTLDIAGGVESMLFSLSNNMGPMVDSIVGIISTLVSEGLKGLGAWVEGGGWKDFLDALLAMQQGIEKVIVENSDEFAEIVTEMIPDLMDSIQRSIISASETLGSLAKPFARVVSTLIIGLIDTLTSQEVIDASIQAISAIVEALVTDGQFVSVVTSFVSGIGRIFTNSPNLVNGMLQGIFRGLLNMDWSELGKQIGKGLLDIIGSMFGWAFSGTKETDSKGEKVGKGLLSIMTGGISNLFYADGTDNATRGLHIVGEQGPELVSFKGGERVYSNAETRQILSGGQSNNFNVTFNNLQDTSAYTMIRELKQYNRQMAINGVL